jgi:hypothetical protein
VRLAPKAVTRLPQAADTIRTRGQAGAAGPHAKDFGPWGGSIWFNSSIAWYFGLDVTGLSRDQSDSLITATHELAHLLGVGEAPSWSAQLAFLSGRTSLVGTHSVAIFGAPVPVDPVRAHWAEGIPGQVNCSAQETLMDPSTPAAPASCLLSNFDNSRRFGGVLGNEAVELDSRRREVVATPWRRERTRYNRPRLSSGRRRSMLSTPEIAPVGSPARLRRSGSAWRGTDRTTRRREAGFSWLERQA